MTTMLLMKHRIHCRKRIRRGLASVLRGIPLVRKFMVTGINELTLLLWYCFCSGTSTFKK